MGKKYSIVFLILSYFSASGFSQYSPDRINKSDGQVIPDMSWLNQKEGPRPNQVAIFHSQVKIQSINL